jgi:hypothetical protein
MEKFRNLINEVNEAEINESAYNALFKKISELDNLRMQLSTNKVIAKKIIKELGTGYEKDFKKVDKLLNDALTILEEIQMDAEQAGI